MMMAVRTVLLMLMLSLLSPALATPLPKGIIELDGAAAHALKLSNMDGDAFDLEQHRGKWMLIHFWASWCGPCRREMPTINAVNTRFDPNKLQFVLVNTAESEDTVFKFIGLVAPDMIPLMDKDGAATENWQPRGLPATFFVDPQGKRRYLALGGRNWQKPVYLQFLKQLENSVAAKP